MLFMDIEERIKISVLIKYYGKLLTDKQQQILSMYVDNNLSLSEVSEELSITRQAVKDSLDNALDSLYKMENQLKFINRDEKIKNFVENLTQNQMDTTTKLQIIQLLEDN